MATSYDATIFSCPPTLNASYQHLMDLLPYGLAWPRADETNMARYWRGVAAGHHQIAQLVCDLLAEFDPLTALHTLPEWATALGLDEDACSYSYCFEDAGFGLGLDVAARARLTFSAQPFDPIQLGQDFGLDVEEIDLPPPRLGKARIGCFHVGAGAGVACHRVRRFRVLNPPALEKFRMGCSRLGMPLCYRAKMKRFECLVDQYRPASVVFKFY